MKIKSRIWVVKESTGEEFMFMGENAPVKENGSWSYDGVIIELPKGCVRNLTKVVGVTGEAVEITQKQQRRVSFQRNLKNRIIHTLLDEKYGENAKAGYLLEVEKILEKMRENNNNNENNKDK